MMRREEKRRKFHEALLRTLYPPPSPPSYPSPQPPPPEVDDETFDVTLIDPEDYVKICSSNHDEGDSGIESETTQKLSRAQRKRLRKKRLKDEAARRGELIGPLPPLKEIVIDVERGADIQSNGEDGGGDDGSCGDGNENEEQSVRRNAQEKEEKVGGNDKMGKVKKRREAKKLAKESSKSNSSPMIQSQKTQD